MTLRINRRPILHFAAKSYTVCKDHAAAAAHLLGNIISSGVDAPTSFHKASSGHLASTYIFQFGLGSALQRTTILHLNVRPIAGLKWSTIQVQKSTIYLQATSARLFGALVTEPSQALRLRTKT
jgi:hypothetical protein